MPHTDHDGLRIHHREAGDPDGTPLVLLHGLTLDTRMFDRLAEHLPDLRLVLVDLRGHGESDRPAEPHRYSWDLMAGDAVATMDHLGIERAIVGGLSLGADVTLAFALAHPERTAGLIIEMPVLSESERWARFVFGLMARLLRAGEVPLEAALALGRRVPLPSTPREVRAVLGAALSIDPIEMASVLEGLLAAPVPDHDPVAVGDIEVPALVIGHRHDPIHALDDARDLARHLPNAELLQVSSILELRFRPAKLAAAVRRLVEAVEGRRPLAG